LPQIKLKNIYPCAGSPFRYTKVIISDGMMKSAFVLSNKFNSGLIFAKNFYNEEAEHG
jgi:hypothetical protein